MTCTLDVNNWISIIQKCKDLCWVEQVANFKFSAGNGGSSMSNIGFAFNLILAETIPQ